MLLIGLFTKYFLLLMVIVGIIVGIIDAKKFDASNMKTIARKARVIGFGYIVLGIGLFVLRTML